MEELRNPALRGKPVGRLRAWAAVPLSVQPALMLPVNSLGLHCARVPSAPHQHALSVRTVPRHSADGLHYHYVNFYFTIA